MDYCRPGAQFTSLVTVVGVVGGRIRWTTGNESKPNIGLSVVGVVRVETGEPEEINHYACGGCGAEGGREDEMKRNNFFTA